MSDAGRLSTELPVIVRVVDENDNSPVFLQLEYQLELSEDLFSGSIGNATNKKNGSEAQGITVF